MAASIRWVPAGSLLAGTGSWPRHTGAAIGAVVVMQAVLREGQEPGPKGQEALAVFCWE